MKVTLNLATNPMGAQRVFWLSALVAGILVLGLTLGIGIKTWNAWAQATNPRVRLAELRGRLAELTHTQQELEARLQTPGAQSVLEQAAFYNRLLERKAVSWAELFSALEKHLPDRVRVLELAPELQEDGSLRLDLRVGAESPAALVRFLQALEQGPEFSQVTPHSQQRSTRPGEDRILADVSALYRSRR